MGKSGMAKAGWQKRSGKSGLDWAGPWVYFNIEVYLFDVSFWVFSLGRS